jgi:hypothetical protein
MPIRDGAEKFGFEVEDLAVGGDSLGASEQHIALHAGGSLGEPVKG